MGGGGCGGVGSAPLSDVEPSRFPMRTASESEFIKVQEDIG
jgi:hypothetical protein